MARGRLNEERFNASLIQARVREARDIAWSPHEALTWLAEGWVKAFNAPARTPDPLAMAVRRGWRTEQDWLSWLEGCFDSLTNGRRYPVGGGVALKDNHSLDLFAYAMTDATCMRHRRDE